MSALPMTGITLTRGERRRMSSMSTSRRLAVSCRIYPQNGQRNSRMTCGRNEVEQRVDTVIPEPGIALDSRLFGKNIVVLPLEVRPDLTKSCIQLVQ